MNERYRTLSTIAIWLGVGFALGVSGSGDVANEFNMIMTMILSFAAVISTGIIWRTKTDFNEMQFEQQEKQKRSSGDDSRLELLMELLDESERRDIRQRLMEEVAQDDGEISLQQLLGRENRHR